MFPFVVIVNVDVPVGVTGDDENVHVAFVGQPEVTDRATDSDQPPIDVTVIVELPGLPCWTVIEAGFADNEKSGCVEPPQPENLNEPMFVYQP